MRARTSLHRENKIPNTLLPSSDDSTFLPLRIYNHARPKSRYRSRPRKSNNRPNQPQALIAIPIHRRLTFTSSQHFDSPNSSPSTTTKHVNTFLKLRGSLAIAPHSTGHTLIALPMAQSYLFGSHLLWAMTSFPATAISGRHRSCITKWR